MATRLNKYFADMLGFDKCRISKPMGKMFLIGGNWRHTSQDPGQNIVNGKAKDWWYINEVCVASGDTVQELVESAKEYKMISGMTMKEYFMELISNQQDMPPEYAKVVEENWDYLISKTARICLQETYKAENV